MYYHLTRIYMDANENQTNNELLEYERYISYSEATQAENDFADLTNEIKSRHMFLTIL
jgi:hypothetical protein